MIEKTGYWKLMNVVVVGSNNSESGEIDRVHLKVVDTTQYNVY